ncbi:MAG: PrsW family intramembrane metalloprotease [Mogibacterium sp.]|nr:PrsW family intramembrane metalloprotease [Mogibacterium sp.]
MHYIENIYVCITAPLLIAVFCTRGKGRLNLLFLLGGMTVCLLSSYITTFIAAAQGADATAASLEIAPLTEEVMKFLPVLFYILVLEPRQEAVPDAMLLTSVGFATFENVCYLTTNGASNILFLVIRGFGTGAMHVACGILVAAGLYHLWDRLWLRKAGTIGFVALAATLHGIYNILVSQNGIAAYIGYIIPLMVVAFVLVFGKINRGKSI